MSSAPAPGDATEPAPEHGRVRRAGILADRPGSLNAAEGLDSAINTVAPEQRWPIKAGGLSVGGVEAALAKLDADGDGRISREEVAKLGKLGMQRGFADAAARDLFRRAEVGAALFAEQPGRGVTADYLDREWRREVERVPGTGPAELAQVQSLILPQADAQLAADVIPRLAAIADAKLEVFGRAAGKGVLRATGYGAVAIIDRDGDGKVGAGDRFIGTMGSGVHSGKMMGVGDVQRAAGLGRAYAAYAAKPPAFLNPSRPDAFPSSSWKHKSYLGPEGTRVGWQLADGVSASAALREFRRDPSAFQCDCATAKQLFALHALAEELGDADFDAVCREKGLFVGYGAAHQDGALAKAVLANVGSSSSKPADYEPGWMGYAELSVEGRPDLLPAMRDAGWGGEHFVVTVAEDGTKKVLAHPFGELDASKLEDKLREKLAADFGVDPAKVRISYRQPQMYDAEAARSILAP